MGPSDTLCSSIPVCIYNFQPLFAGGLAVIAAIIAAGGVYLSARLPLKHKERVERQAEARRVQVNYRVLLSDLLILHERVRQAEGTIKVVIAARATVTDETRAKVRLIMPELCSDWAFMSLVPSDLADAILALGRIVDSHNFDMDRAGGSFGADNFRELIFQRLKSISEHVAKLRERIVELI